MRESAAAPRPTEPRLHAELLALLWALTATPSPRGNERTLADEFLGLGRERYPAVQWVGDEAPNGGASVIARSTRANVGPHVLVCSHLDTSLSGDPARDRPATGSNEPVAPPAYDPDLDEFSAQGLGVAKAAAAAATAGYLLATRELARCGAPHRAELLLAGSGTHASPFVVGDDLATTGLARYLVASGRPEAALLVKSGPLGVLHEEPGSAFLRVELRGVGGPVLFRERARPPGGLLAHVGLLTAAIEAWRRDHLAARSRGVGQLGAEVGIGHLSAGLDAKPDLLPAVLTAQLYLTTLPDDDLPTIAAQLAATLRQHLAPTPLGDVEVSVDHRVVHHPGRTPADQPWVRCAVRAWADVYERSVPRVEGWPGSTDGAHLRHLGVPTVRFGPIVEGDPRDGRRERVRLDELVRTSQVVARAIVAHVTGT